MIPSVFVGNDVVDLSNPRTEGRSSDARFVERVYAPEERHEIEASSDPELELWSRWAAKETGFKVVSKLLGEPPPFVHRAFRVSWSASDTPPSDDPSLVRFGRVVYEPHGGDHPGAPLSATVWVTLSGHALHGVGYAHSTTSTQPVEPLPRVALADEPGAVWSGGLEELSSRFTARELDAVYSHESAAVRIGARSDLARLLDVEERRVEIVCAPGPTSQRPPRVLLDGDRAEADVSLSHDGRWIAWAIWVAS